MFSPIILHRVAHWMFVHHIPKLPGFIYRFNYLVTHCDLPPSVSIGKNVIFKHFGSGVVVHHKVVIEDNVEVHPQVIIGQKIGRNGPVSLISLIIREGVILGAGCKIFASGDFEIGKNVIVGGGAVVIHSVSDGMTVVGIPARPLKSGKISMLSENP